MSFDYNYKFWVATQQEIDDVLKRQEVYKKLKPVGDKYVQHYLFAEIYVRYVHLVNKLGYIYHNTFQVQKRDVIRKLVESSTQRLLELKNELKNIELSEFIYVDKTLIEKRLTPDDIIVFTPQYFPYWRPVRVQEMIYGPRKTLEEIETIERQEREAREGIAPDQSKVKAEELETDPRKTVMGGKRQTGLDKKLERAKYAMKGKGETVIMDPAKKKIYDACTLIKSHERLRVARIWLTNIKYDPQTYKPRMRADEGVQYVFTHKPTQAMLIPVKRTRFEANYFSKKRAIGEFNYYVKPVVTAQENKLFVSAIGDDDEWGEDSSSSSLEEDSDFVPQILESESVMSEESEYSKYEKDSVTNYVVQEDKMLNEAATLIQAAWKGYRQVKRYKILLQQKAVIYGMVREHKPKSTKAKILKDRMEDSAKHRLIKEKYDEEFIKFCEDERARILRVRGPWIMEDISDNIRDWFREFYYKVNNFHPYPEEAKGGTLLLLRGETMDVFKFNEKKGEKKMTKDQKQKLKEKAKEQKKKEKEKQRKANQKLAKRRAKMKAMGIIDFADEMVRSKCVAKIEQTIANYKKQWADIDEQLNKKEKPITEWVTSDYFCEIHQELQLTVDEMMRIEYELLRKALAKDQKKKYKPPKNRKRKNKKKKGRKKKGPKDITAHRCIESLYYELQDAGIIRPYPKKTFDYFIGERNHCAFDILNIHLKDTPPYQGEIKDVLSEYILGMGPLNITKPKAICLVGPTHCGKRILCDIMATEIDAVLFDISPENTAPYASNIKYFIHLILKMSKICQPSILFIRDVHRVFWKKVPPEFVDMNPRLLAPQLKKKILKFIKKEDKVLLLGTTDAPWSAKGKMKKLFQKMLLVPRTEYATNFILRREYTLQHRAIPRVFDFSALTLVTRDYISGDVVDNINETVNVRRRMDLSRKPLHQMEFLEKFLDKEVPHFPMEVKMWEKFAKWYRKSNKMAKKRAKMMKARMDAAKKLEEKNKMKKR